MKAGYDATTDELTSILVLVDDLMLATRVENTLRASGYTVRIVPTTAELLAATRASVPGAIIVRFGAPFLDWEGAIRAVRDEPSLAAVPLLAFGPHVETESRAAARAAGATRVVTNGAFFNGMPRIVAALLSDAALLEEDEA